MNKFSFSKYPLYANEIPTFRQKANDKFVANGKNNDYPEYLTYLFNSSGIHNAIVRGKATYIYGKGLNIKRDWQGDRVKLQSVLNSINSYQTFEELEKKAIFDKTLYGGKYYLIEWGLMGKPKSVKLLPYRTVRTNVEKTEFYYSNNWTKEQRVSDKYRRGLTKFPEDTITFEALNLTNKVGKQVLFIADYNPASDIYPLPEYQPSNTSIETDIEVGFFHLNNVKTGFAAGTMITLFNGVDTENPEQQRELDYAFKSKTSGTDNAGELLINNQDPNSTPPVITPLRSNELDKQFEQLSKDTINKILQGHRVSNGLLFGVKTPGELGGGRSEFDLAWEHFCNTYVKPKQQEEEDDINYLLQLYGIMGEPIEIVVLDPIGLELTTDVIMSVLNTAEKRKLVLDRMGIEPIVEQITPKAKFRKFKDDYLVDKFSTIGESAELFNEVIEVGKYEKFDSETDALKITEILKDEPKITISKLAEKTGISETNIYKILDKLAVKNQLQVKYIERGNDIVIDVENITNETEVQLFTKWKYAGIKDSKNRDFCARMLSLNKLYTRAEIESLKNDMDDFNTDVWEYKGGWYHDPARDVNVPQCRHYWQQIIVKRK